MAIDAFFKLFILILVEGEFFGVGVVIPGHQVLALHQCLLLHLVDLQLLQRNVDSLALQLPPQELVLLLQLIYDSSFEDLIGFAVLGAELKVVGLSDNFGVIV